MAILRILTQFMDWLYAQIQKLLNTSVPSLPFRQRQIFTLIPSLLSLARIPLGIAIWIAVRYTQPFLLQGLLHTASALSDAYDGLLARRWNCTSRLGALLDPFCDKIYLFCCAAAYWDKLDHFVFGALIVCEGVILFLQLGGLLVARVKKIPLEDEDLKSHIWGKSKFALQCAAMAAAMLLLRPIAQVFAGLAVVAGLGSIVEFQIKRAGRGAAAQKQA